MEQAKGYFIPVFHAYIPLGLEGSVEERYLFEYLSDTLYPLLRVFEGLENEAVPYGFTLSISPVLAGMLENPSLMLRFADYLEWRLVAVAKLADSSNVSEQELATFYSNKFKDLKYWHLERYRYRPLKAIFNIAALGNLEVIFSNAANGILPVLEGVENAARAEVRGAVSEYKLFSEGAKLQGLWLSEAAYSVGNELLMEDEGIRYFFVTGNGFKSAAEPVVNGTARPVLTGGNIVAFGFNQSLTDKISIKPNAYYLDGAYRDVGKDFSAYLKSDDFPFGLFGAVSAGIATGIKLAGRDGACYDPAAAAKRADIHAGHYLSQLAEVVERCDGNGNVVVVGLEHEQTGGVWGELSIFVDMLLRKMHFDQELVRATTPSNYLSRNNEFQSVTLGDSAIFEEGVFSDFYREEREIYLPELHLAALRLQVLEQGEKRVLAQMSRELLLAGGCEWSFYVRRGLDVGYVKERQRKRLARFAACEVMLNRGELDLEALAALEIRTPVLSTIGVETFC